MTQNKNIEHTQTENTYVLTELGRNAQIVFHDLSNRLTALNLSVEQMGVQLIRDTDRLKEYTRRSEETRQQIENINDLLRSHIEGTTETLKTFDPYVELSRIVATFTERARRENVNLQLLQTLKSARMINGNTTIFEHIFTNLISNAFDSFTSKPDPATKRNIQICVSEEGRGGTLCVSVSDTGCGISPKHLKHIFDLGFSTKSTGHGIGLHRTKDYVEKKFSGTIQTKSSPQGSEFFVYFPKKTETTRQLPETAVK